MARVTAVSLNSYEIFLKMLTNDLPVQSLLCKNGQLKYLNLYIFKEIQDIDNYYCYYYCIHQCR